MLRWRLDALDVRAKGKEGETTNDLFAFSTTKANAVVAPIHAKAVPVILTTQDEGDTWMTASTKEALTLQRQLPTRCGSWREGRT